MVRFLRAAGVAACLLGQTVDALTVNFDNDRSVKDAASTVAFGLMKYYTGNRTGDVPGNLPDPYFWWEAGAMFGTMIDYWALTGDATYNAVTTQAMLHQVGDDKDFMPRNQTRTEGNDDQGFWAMAAMSAAENNFPNPPADQPQWLALVQAVVNQYITRWDTSACGGGLRWQIFTFNNGFNYKNSISNGCFFNLAARLARYTGNQTYADWAQRVWDWEVSAGLITDKYDIYDGATIWADNNCPKLDQIQWSYNHGIFLHGAAVMYNITNSAVWRRHTEGILTSTRDVFYNGTILQEQACEPFGLCNTDQQSFKGYLTRWMARSLQMASFLAPTITPMLRSSAEAAALACSGSPAGGFGGIPGTACGFKWVPKGQFDGQVGVGEQMNALSAVMYTLVSRQGTAAPVTADTGGTSVGDVNAGMTTSLPYDELPPIEIKDRVAAGFVTTALLLGIVAGCTFVMK